MIYLCFITFQILRFQGWELALLLGMSQKGNFKLTQGQKHDCEHNVIHK